jgi:PTS system cellobiose-specific IIB component
VRFKLAANKKITDEHQIPIGVIDSIAYGTLNGAKVLDQALGLID